jgi:glycosyltransferase involved in cell wall biosynthesis
MGIGIVFSHENIQEIVKIILIVSIVRVLLFMLAHKFNDKLKFVWSNIEDFFGLFNIASKYEAQQTVAKKILIFNWRDTRHKFAGGAEVYIHELAKRWVKAGHKVTVFCGNDGHSPRYETIDGVEIVRRGGFYFVYIWAFLYYVLKFRDKYDIVIDCENGIPFFTPLYVQKKKYLVIHHIHQEVFRKSLSPFLSTIATTLEMKVMPLVYRKIPVITVSPSSKQEIMNWKISKKEPVIIYNGVDLKRYKPAKKSETPMVLYLGRLQQYKSLHVLIEAAKSILEHVPKAEFVIAGDGDELVEANYKRVLAYSNGAFYLSPIVFLWAKMSLKIKVQKAAKAAAEAAASTSSAPTPIIPPSNPVNSNATEGTSTVTEEASTNATEEPTNVTEETSTNATGESTNVYKGITTLGNIEIQKADDSDEKKNL